MVAEKRHGIERLTQFAMEVIRRSGEEALLYYGKGNSRIKFDEELVTEADSHLMGFFQDSQCGWNGTPAAHRAQCAVPST